MKSKALIFCGIILVLIGILKPNLSKLIDSPNTSVVVIEKPSNADLLEASKDVIKALSDNPDRKVDGKKLSELYADLAILVELDGENKIIKNTSEIKEANAISGSLLKLDIKGKYPELAGSAKALMIMAIGDDMLELDDSLRQKAVNGFKALSWACLEGSK